MAAQQKYKKHELREHILEKPGMYVGSVDIVEDKIYVYDEETKRMVQKQLSYCPALLKLLDEIVTNAMDQSMRLKTEEAKGTLKNIKHVKNIRININRDTGVIEVYNDGDGIEVEKHETHNNTWIPELIFGELLTSSNYNADESKLVAGSFGFGSKLTNIFSKEFTVETVDHRNGKHYIQKFYDNMKTRDPAKVTASKKAPFTKITFKPDYPRFGMAKLTDDMYELFKKRAYDACATTDKDVSIYFNDEKLEIKDFEKYADLYIGDKQERPRAYEKTDDGRWEVIATYSETNQFEQVSFVNGINTLRGGKHVEYITNQITKAMVDMVKSKKKKEVKPQHIKENLFVFVKALVINPSFDSQTKETLTTQVSKFGSKCELTDKFLTNLYKTGIADKAVSLTEFHEKKKVAKTDGKKTSRVLIPKLDDANKAGTKDSVNCTLILTEGDSAKTMAIAGLSVIGRDRYGVFPLRGKIMNVKDANLKKLAENEEITNLKKILGLEQGKDYKDLSSLRYGSIMIMTDQDHDGSHIKGLLFNVFQSIWPSLYKQNGFLTSMLTPIIKVKHNTSQDTIEFYSMTDFEKWKHLQTQANTFQQWRVKYYKGLGTSTPEEAKEYFRNMKKTTYIYTGKDSDDGIDLAFNKKRADDRKDWLMKFDREKVLDYTIPEIPYEEFIDKDLIHFSNRDLERSIPSLVDGFKESTRKIFYGCQKRKLYSKEIKVAQLSGYISEVSAYHHGETSLQQAIIGMSQNFVGANNINLLEPIGQFGTRIKGGADAASPRYIHTKLNELAKTIFIAEDNAVLHRLDDDGMLIEHEFYVPVIPMILVNGGLGIGTGFSTNIPNHNPTDIIAECKKIINALDKQPPIQTKEELKSMSPILDKVHLSSSIKPWYLGFQGTITPDKEGTFQSKGNWKWLDDQTVEITELPIGTWTEDYKDFLTSLLANNSPVLKDFENHYTDKHVRFILKFYPNVRSAVEMNFESEFKLVSNKNLSMNNIHLYNEEGAIQKYKNTEEIIKSWSKVRLATYYDRKKYQLKQLEHKYTLISAKVRFIQEIIDNTLNVMNRKQKELEEELKAKHYPQLAEEEPTEETEENKDKPPQPLDYNYLIKMPIQQLTFEKKQALEKEAHRLDMAIKELRNKAIHHIWLEELHAVEEAWNAFRHSMESAEAEDVPKQMQKVVRRKKAAA